MKVVGVSTTWWMVIAWLTLIVLVGVPLLWW
jgi:hypothetical protein